MGIFVIEMTEKGKKLVIEKKLIWNMIVVIEYNKKFHYYYNKKPNVMQLDK